MAARHFVVQSDKGTKQRKRFQNEGSEVDLACSFQVFGTPKARCSPEPPMCEPLLLANSYTHTLRPVRSRASTLAKKPARPHALLVLHCLVGWLLDLRSYFWGYGLTHRAASFRRGLATRFDMRTNLVDGCSRIARGEPWAGSVTGGEACGYPCSEKEGFTHQWFWRAPCFWGAKNLETAR